MKEIFKGKEKKKKNMENQLPKVTILNKIDKLYKLGKSKEITQKKQEENEKAKKELASKEKYLDNNIKVINNSILNKIDKLCEIIKISNDDLATLLKKETGKKWKFKFLNNQFLSRDRFFVSIYETAIIIVNEKCSWYKNIEDFIKNHRYDLSSFLNEEMFFYKSSIDKEKINEYIKENNLENLNWAKLYFMKKFGLESILDSKINKNEQKSVGNLILKVIENYISQQLNIQKAEVENQ